jgi:DNA-directed RNA polymerase II subunit RPB1
MDNDIAGILQAIQKSDCPVKSNHSRLKGKDGRLRGNLIGKRVDFSACTVITGDPNLESDEVGVPRSIALTLTYPGLGESMLELFHVSYSSLCSVTPYIVMYLQELVRNRPANHPGARYVIHDTGERDTGERIDLWYNKRANTFLQFGWIVV